MLTFDNRKSTMCLMQEANAPDAEMQMHNAQTLWERLKRRGCMRTGPEAAVLDNKTKKPAAGMLHYFKQHWQLYVIFLLPAFVLTFIFKYIPMSGIMIAFEKYNPIKGVFHSPFVGFEYFQRFLASPDFLSYLGNTLKLSVYGLLWGFPVPIVLAFLLNRIANAARKRNMQLVLYLPNFISVIQRRIRCCG